jgi:hypothetical protein
MAITQTLVDGIGPLPLTANFNAEGDGVVTFFVAGSGWAGSAGKIGMNVLLDGELLGVCVGFTNEGTSHKTFVPIFLPAKLAFGPHTLELQAFPGTNTDINDQFNVTLFY